MRRRKIVAAAAALIVIAGGLSAALTIGRSHGRPSLVDVDKKSDCWARPDRHGSRHCDTRPGH